MPVHIVGKNNPECPLCLKPFKRASHVRREYFFCRKCNVQILGNDPMLGQWNNQNDPDSGEEGIPCANGKCREKMRIFCRSDGFMKAVCPNKRCGSEVVSDPNIPDGSYIVGKGEGVGNLEAVKSSARKDHRRRIG